MRNALLLSCLLLVTAGESSAQTPPPATAPPAGQAAPAPRRAAPRAAQPASRSGIAMAVTDGAGGILADVHVEMTGPMSRSGDTDVNGQLNFPGLPAGTYRLVFTGDHVRGFEREVVLRAGQVTRLDIVLAAAPRPEPPPPPPAPLVGPSGTPQLGSLNTLVDRELGAREPRREVLLSCSGNTRNTLIFLSQEQPERIYDAAESTFYVLRGQGTVRVGTIQSVVEQGSFVAVPRSTPFSLSRQGNRPLVLLWSLSGAPCEQAR